MNKTKCVKCRIPIAFPYCHKCEIESDLALKRELVKALKDSHDAIESEWGDCHSWKKNKKNCDLCALITRAEKTL